MALSLTTPPKSVCILRLSALGDISHTLPVVRTLQEKWPDTALTWVIGSAEYHLVSDIPNIEFIIFDKANGWKAYSGLRNKLHGYRFDILLHMQMSLRASIASLFIPATIRIGFDRKRAKDLQWLFTNHKIASKDNQHVVDSFFGFTEALGISEHVLRWDIPIPESSIHYARSTLPGKQKTLVISPCSSMAYRNWNTAGYACLADYACHHHGMRVVLTGGTSAIEEQYGREIEQQTSCEVLNLVGKTNIKHLLAILEKSHVVLAPDSGPAHLATAVGTPVIGLYASTNPDRARPYLSAKYVVNRYPEAVLAKYNKPVESS